jgi:hypothetical protein
MFTADHDYYQLHSVGFEASVFSKLFTSAESFNKPQNSLKYCSMSKEDLEALQQIRIVIDVCTWATAMQCLNCQKISGGLTGRYVRMYGRII